MFDQMSMPILFAILISTLAIVSIGVFIAVRVMAERAGAAKPAAAAHGSTHPQELPASTADATSVPELD